MPCSTQKNIYSIRKSLKSSRGMSPHKIFQISPSFYNTFTVLPKRLPNCLQNPAPIIFLQMFSMTFTGIPFHLIIRRSIWKVLDDCFKKIPQVGAYALTRFIIEKQLGVMMYSNSHCLWVRWTYDFATFAPSNKIRLDENQKKTVDFFFTRQLSSLCCFANANLPLRRSTWQQLQSCHKAEPPSKV